MHFIRCAAPRARVGSMSIVRSVRVPGDNPAGRVYLGISSALQSQRARSPCHDTLFVSGAPGKSRATESGCTRAHACGYMGMHSVLVGCGVLRLGGRKAKRVFR